MDLIAKYGRVLKLGGRTLPVPVLRPVESQTSLMPTTPAIVGSSISRDVSKSVLNRCGPCGKGHDQVTKALNDIFEVMTKCFIFLAALNYAV